MSLDWNLSEIEDYEDVCYCDSTSVPHERRLDQVTQHLIWMTMAVGINEITEKNRDRFHRRVRAYEQVAGKSISHNVGSDQVPKWELRFTRIDDVAKHVGLSTNASDLSEAKFKKELVERLEHEFGPF